VVGENKFFVYGKNNKPCKSDSLMSPYNPSEKDYKNGLDFFNKCLPIAEKVLLENQKKEYYPQSSYNITMYYFFLCRGAEDAYGAGQIEQALNIYLNLYNNASYKEIYTFGLARCYRKLNKIKKAINYYKKCISLQKKRYSKEVIMKSPYCSFIIYHLAKKELNELRNE